MWAAECPATRVTCTPGTWTAWGSSSPENYPLRFETEHFAFYWPDERDVTEAAARSAADYMENVLWNDYLSPPINWPEPYCDTADKLKTSVHIIESGLYGGLNRGPGIWVGPGAMADHWGLGHEWVHALQALTPAFPDCGSPCWIYEAHANFMPHQLEEGRSNVHCSEMLVNAPHVYYGSSRDRYCNWQFFEFLKDKHCCSAVNGLWNDPTSVGRDIWPKLMGAMGWDLEQLNDLFGEWAVHNVTWDYQNPPGTDGGDQGEVYRSSYGALTTNASRAERRLRITSLEPMDEEWSTNRRFQVPNLWAPQRWGYNVIQLHAEEGATSVTVAFRGVTESKNGGWRWGLVATDSGLTTSRYSRMMSGSDGELSFCVNPGESLWLVVVGTPTEYEKILWDQLYHTIPRYPYMVRVDGAWPAGFRNGTVEDCPAGTSRHSNGGGCATAQTSASAYVGPYAKVVGGTVTGGRIEDHAVVTAGTVSGGTVGGLSVLSNGFTVAGSAQIFTTFYPVGFYERNQGASGTAMLYGDVEYRGDGLNKSSGSFSGFVDTSTESITVNDTNPQPPYTWRD